MIDGLAKLPWAVDHQSIGCQWTNSISISDDNGGHIAHLTRGYQGDAEGDGCASFINADFIVKAVNNHGPLVRALADALAAFEDIKRLCADSDNDTINFIGKVAEAVLEDTPSHLTGDVSTPGEPNG
jgi:hypothetical protein